MSLPVPAARTTTAPAPVRLRALVAGLVAALVVLVVLVALVGPVAGARAATGRPAAGAGSPTTLTGAPGSPGRRPVLVVGLAGLDVHDLSESATPHLWALARSGATGTLVVRSVHLSTCPVDGWLTLGAGGRAAQPGDGDRPACRDLPTPAAARPGAAVPGWSEYLQAADRTHQDARLGSLAQGVQRAGSCVTAIGPGAGLAAADESGHVGRWSPYPADGAGLRQALAACPLTLVDPGQVRADRPDRAAQVRALDDRLGQLVAAAPRGALVVAAALSDDGGRERLRPVVLAGDGWPAGALRSSSTRQDDYVLLTDLTTTVTAALGLPADPSWDGRALTAVPEQTGPGARIGAMRDHADAARLVEPVAAPFWVTWLLLMLVPVLVVVLRARHQAPGARAAGRRLLARVATAGACVPAASFLAALVPWWRAPLPVPALWATIYGIAAVLAGVALLGPWRRHPFGPAACVAALTTLVICGDAVSGSPLTLSSLLGEQPTIAGRFYGLGNVAFSLMATAVLLVMTGLGSWGREHRRARASALVAVVVGLVAVAVDGAPQWGADLGGPVALVPAVGLLGLVLLGARLTWRRVVGVGLVAAALVVGLAVLDYLRPPGSRTHLGRFVQTLVDGGGSDVVTRKLQQNLHMLLTAPAAFLVPVGLVLVAWALARPGSRLGRPLAPAYARVPLLRAGLACVLVMWVIGLLTNDTGVAIPAVGGMLAVPLLVAVALSARDAGTADADGAHAADAG